MGKEAKTNAMRMLDRKKVKYEAIAYDCGEFIDGIHCADITGAPHDQSFKTLVMEGKSGGYYVFVVYHLKNVSRLARRKNSRYDPCKGSYKDHGLYPRRLQPSWNEKKLSGGV